MSKKRDLSIVRHSAAHLLAHAVHQLYPGTKMTIGPATKEGFFYDFLPVENFKETDLPAIDQRMHELAEQDIPLTHRQIPKDEAREIFKDNPFKLELIDMIPGDTVGLAEQGDFYDLCRGGHVESTGQIKNFKLTGISGAYWRADKEGTALQRISGTAFYSPEDLAAYEQRQEELAKYDHRRLGKQMDLFSFQEEGPGFPFFHPKGKRIYNVLADYMRKIQRKHNYQEVATPTMLDASLWKQSGHYDHYKDNMYFSEIDEKEFAIKPMNCPGSILIYKSRPRSYRELPLKLAEEGRVHRHELSGVLHGLFRVRTFAIDDAHIYCTPEQIKSEVLTLIEIIKNAYKKFGFDTVKIALSTKPDNAMGDDALWEKAESALSEALNEAGVDYAVQEGEGAFYGPKIEFVIEDSMGREWQCGTIQVDFNNPENFDLAYINSEGKKVRPVMIHQAIYGSYERFLAILLEHHKGQLPFFAAPVQARILTISDKQNEYAQKLFDTLRSNDIRVELDTTADQLSAKIKSAQEAKVPWMIIIGGKEAENNTVTIRHLDGTQEKGIPLDQAVQTATELNAIE